MVVAPCPDDAVELAGGLIAAQRARDVEVTVLCLDGSDDGPARARVGHDTALSILGIDAVTELGRLDDADVLASAITAVGHFDLIVAPWTAVMGADTETAAVGRAAEQAAARCGAALLFGIPAAVAHALPIELRGARLVRLDLDDESRERRRRALERTSLPDGGAAGSSSEFFLTAPEPIGADLPPIRTRGLATGVPPVSSGRSGVET